MHGEPKNNFILSRNVYMYYKIPFLDMFFFFQSTVPVNELIVVIRDVLLLNSGSKQCQMLASLQSAIAILK